MDVKDRKMIRILIKIFLAISLLILAACQQEIPKGALRIDTIPPDTPLTIDGNFVGNSPAGAGQYFAIELHEGEHVISALVDIDKEKQLFLEKTVFVAPDTLQTMTLELEERLTAFGVQEKARREAEKAEKKRLAELEQARKEKEAKERIARAQEQARKLHLRMVSKNQDYTDFINTQTVNVGDESKTTQSFNTTGCRIEFTKKYGGDAPSIVKRSVNARDLELLKSDDFQKTHFYLYESGLFGTKSYKKSALKTTISCKNDRECITRNGRTLKDDATRLIEGITTHEAQLRNLHTAFMKVIENCQ